MNANSTPERQREALTERRDLAHADLLDRLGSIERRLRGMADEIAYSRRTNPSEVENVIHDVTWGVANLNLDLLSKKAREFAVAAALLDALPGATTEG
jgi:hypothetical protein